MTQLRKLDDLMYWLSVAQSAHKRFPCALTLKFLQYVYSQICALYAQYPNLKYTYRTLQTTKQQIRDSFDPISLCLLDRTQAMKHLNKLLTERNQCAYVYKSDWEHLVKLTLKELHKCKHVFFIDMKSDQWHIMK